jgi:transcriptional regulator with XRE-family HTH domain
MAYLLLMNPTNRIRELRKKAGLNQQQLANLTGVSQPAISQIENDERPLTVDWMRAFARAFDCAPADLLGVEDNPDRLLDEERELILRYRAADEGTRENIQRVTEALMPFRHKPSRNVA